MANQICFPLRGSNLVIMFFKLRFDSSCCISTVVLILQFRYIFLMFWLVFRWFPMVRWCGICVIEQMDVKQARGEHWNLGILRGILGGPISKYWGQALAMLLFFLAFLRNF